MKRMENNLSYGAYLVFLVFFGPLLVYVMFYFLIHSASFATYVAALFIVIIYIDAIVGFRKARKRRQLGEEKKTF